MSSLQGRKPRELENHTFLQLKGTFAGPHCTNEQSRDLAERQTPFGRSGGSKMPCFNQLLGDTDAADLWTTFEWPDP